MIAHIVLFRPRPDVDAHQLWLFAQSVIETCSSIPSISRARIGKAVSVDAGYPRSFGDMTYSYAAVLEFEDRKALVDYLQHPLHQAMGRQFWEVSEATLVFEADSRSPSDWTADELAN